ncbi:MAG: PspA/IM30 family protein [Planctomycetota bacterium]|nr:PspA/IM30 family protein [Planctomycetota bacterium]
MSLIARMKRVFKSFVGWFVELGEDPELILKQNIRELEAQIPSLNENIATIKAHETLKRKDVEKASKEEAALEAKIKAALKQGNRDLALSFATTLNQTRQNKVEAQAQHALAVDSYEKAKKVKRAFLQEKERKVTEARNALNAKKKAEWQAKVADAMTSFSVTGVDATHEEMIRKIEESAAQSEAKLEIALENVGDNPSLELEQEARKLTANDTLLAFEQELGLIEAAPVEAAQQPAPADLAEETSPQEKTIGPRERELA